jgi:hypothetical protein
MARTCGASLWRSQPLISSIMTIITMFSPAPALAHAGERGQVLLLPTKLYIVGGALAVALSFAAVAFASKQDPYPPRQPTLTFGAVPRWLPTAASMASFVFLVTLLLAGLFGNPDPLSNPLPPAFWTLWWIGFTILTVMAGNIWKILNPWIGPYRLAMRLGQGAPIFAYPEAFGCLPALLLFFAFAWFELVYPTPQDPSRLAVAIIVYSLITFTGLILFGPAWLDRGDAFTVFFTMVSTLSPLNWIAHRDNNSLRVKLGLGRPGRWLTEGPPLSPTFVAFVLLALSTVSFDGLSRTFAWIGWLGINPLEFPGRSALLLPNTFGLILSFVALAAAYAIALALGQRLSNSEILTSGALGSYVLSLLPIAIGFHFAHYLPNLLLDWQYALRGLSDPFGLGWDLLRTSDIHTSSSMAFDHTTITAIYNIQTSLIVLAHMMAVFTAHRLALSRTHSRRAALIGQIPLTILMIAYTVYGLWLLSTPVIG